MASSKDSYIIKVHFPETEEAMFEIRKGMGEAYVQFVKEYILNMPVSDEAKSKLYEKVFGYLKNCKYKSQK